MLRIFRDTLLQNHSCIQLPASMVTKAGRLGRSAGNVRHLLTVGTWVGISVESNHLGFFLHYAKQWRSNTATQIRRHGRQRKVVVSLFRDESGGKDRKRKLGCYNKTRKKDSPVFTFLLCESGWCAYIHTEV